MELERCERQLTDQASAQDVAAAIAQRPRDPFWSLSLDDSAGSLYAEATGDGRSYALHCMQGSEDLVATAALDDRELNALFVSFLQGDGRWRELCRWRPFEEESAASGAQAADADGWSTDTQPLASRLPLSWTALLCIPLLLAGLACWWLFPAQIDQVLAPSLPDGARPHQALFFAIVAVLSLLQIGAERFDHRRRGWAKTIGTMTVSKVSGGSSKTPSRPKLAYSYSVGAQQYRGSRLNADAPAAGSAADMQRIVDRYPVDSMVAVYYRPDQPAEAVLETQARGVNGTWISVLLFGALAWYFATP